MDSPKKQRDEIEAILGNIGHFRTIFYGMLIKLDEGKNRQQLQANLI